MLAGNDLAVPWPSVRAAARPHRLARRGARAIATRAHSGRADRRIDRSHRGKSASDPRPPACTRQQAELTTLSPGNRSPLSTRLRGRVPLLAEPGKAWPLGTLVSPHAA